MAFTPVAGSIAKVSVGTSDVPAINWTLAIDGKVKDVSNFRDGRKKIGTLADAKLTFTLVWDGADEPTATGAANLVPGVIATIKCYTDATKFFSASYTIETVTPKNEGPEGVMMFEATAGLNGSITYPL